MDTLQSTRTPHSFDVSSLVHLSHVKGMLLDAAASRAPVSGATSKVA